MGEFYQEKGGKKKGRSDDISSVQIEKPPKVCLPLKSPAKKKFLTGKSKALAEAVMEEVDFFL